MTRASLALGWTTRITLALTLAGCALPQVALDQANHSANLMMAMQGQLDTLTGTEAFLTNVRKQGIESVRGRILSTKSLMTQDTRIMNESGQTEQTRLFALLQGLSNQRAQDALDLEASLAALDDQLTKLLAPIPSTVKQVAAAQKDIGALGVQRSSKERVSLVADFAKSVKADIAAAASAASAASISTPASRVSPKNPAPAASSPAASAPAV